jgi:hypothetical protein
MTIHVEYQDDIAISGSMKCAADLSVTVNKTPPICTTCGDDEGTGKYLNKPVLRVGIMRNPGFYLKPDPGSDNGHSKWLWLMLGLIDILKTRILSILRLQVMEVGLLILNYKDSSSLARVKRLSANASMTRPSNSMKTALNANNLYGAKRYEELSGGKWGL